MDSENTQQPMLSLPQAGAQLGMTWGQTYNALLRGKLQGEQRGGRWYVDLRSVEILERERSAKTKGALTA